MTDNLKLSKNLKSKIIKEANIGRLDLLNDLYKSNPELCWFEIKDAATGDTILHTAARLGLNDLIKDLVGRFQPFPVDVRNNDSKTALHEAAQSGFFDTVKLLLELGADVNALKRSDWTPLMLACTKDNPEIVRLLLEKGALTDWKNKDGWTALHLTCRLGSLPILELLLNWGANPRIKTNNGRNALHIAALHGCLSIVMRLIEIIDVDDEDSCGNSAVHEAVLGGNFETYQVIKQKSKNIRKYNKAGFNLLHLACSEGHLDIIQDLVEVEKFDVDENMIGPDSPGVRPIHCALRNKKFQCFELLQKLGADTTTPDLNNRIINDYFYNK